MSGKNKLNWILYGLCGYAVTLGIQLVLMPPDWGVRETMVPYFATPMLMLVFGPYLLVPQDAWIWSSSGIGWWLARMVPLYGLHLAFIWGLLSRPGLFGTRAADRDGQPYRELGSGAAGLRIKIFQLALVAGWSALGVWYAIPEVEHVAIGVDASKLLGASVRLAVISDLHSCRYGDGQRGLVEMVESRHPDAVLFVGDIFDDRLPDGPSQSFISQMVKKYPCIYVSGNHEFWSGRITGMKDWLREAGVTVLEGGCRTLSVRGNDICICGVDDPTYIFGDVWDKQLARADARSKVWGGREPAPTASANERPKVRILLSHRPECPEAYAKYDFDLVLTGHAHGGQWRLPGVNRGTYSPDQHFFPRYVDGVYTLANGKPMLVGRGLARESSPVPRFFNHPQVLIVDLM